jgi:hypothetical protein
MRILSAPVYRPDFPFKAFPGVNLGAPLRFTFSFHFAAPLLSIQPHEQTKQIRGLSAIESVGDR